MPSYNKVILVGNLTRDPETKFIPSGAAVCEFSIACNEKYTSKAGEKVEKVHFFDIVAWAKTGELVQQYMAKGRSILVEGKLTQDRWEDNEGKKRSRIRVTAERVTFLGGPKGGDGQGAQGSEVPADPAEEIPF
jgi:single-strand DNA-binding protein